jgi:hypothetical protein
MLAVKTTKHSESVKMKLIENRQEQGEKLELCTLSLPPSSGYGLEGKDEFNFLSLEVDRWKVY